VTDTAFAVDVVDYRGLAKAIRDRINELNISLGTAETLAGIAAGSMAKITSDPPMRRASPYTLLLVLQALSLKVNLTHDPEMAAKMSKRYVKRKERMVRSAVGTPKVIELTPDHMRRIGRMGGRARAALPNASEINRRSALTRWRRVREQAV
jgi:hypothetical protein